MDEAVGTGKGQEQAEKKKRTRGIFGGFGKRKTEKKPKEPKPKKEKKVTALKPKAEKFKFWIKKKVSRLIGRRKKGAVNFKLVEGLIHLTVKKTAKSHTEWLTRNAKTGKAVRHHTQNDFLQCLDFEFKEKVFTLVVLRREELKNSNQSIAEVTAYALSKGYKVPEPEMACFTFDIITPEDFEAMGLTRVLVAHDPIEWESVHLIKSHEGQEWNEIKDEEGSIQFAVSYNENSKGNSEQLVLHSNAYNSEAVIEESTGIAFLVPKK